MAKEKILKSRISIETLEEYYQTALAQYQTEQTRMRTLDLTDRGGLWQALGASFPPYQILPDTNFTSYIKDNLVASIYTIAKSAALLPTSDADKSIITNINLAIEQEWNLANVGAIQQCAGTNAALHNIGITQVGWDDNIIKTTDVTQKGQFCVKDIHPLHFMRDPFAVSLDAAGYCMTYEKYHKSVFLNNKNYREAFQNYVEKAGTDGDINMYIPDIVGAKNTSADKDYYTLVTFWVKVWDEKLGKLVIDEIHTIDCTTILFEKQNIKPSKFPFAILYCNDPGKSLVGVSGPARAFANGVAYNIMDSIALTAVYKNQRPPKFVNSMSGLNLNSFAKHANDADYTFVVNGDASKAVHYQQFPLVDPAVANLKTSLQYGLQMVSGVDQKYTGRNTGSITTTGGTQEMLNRVTVIDTPKINNFQEYTKVLTDLIICNITEFGQKRKYYIPVPNKSKEFKTIEADFPALDADTIFNYQINVSSDLPKNKARMAEMANQLMEKQMQYAKNGGDVQFITPEEWLMFQDLTHKELMLERMGIERMTSAVEDATQVLFQYAALTKEGMDPTEALVAVANTMKNKKQGPAVPETIDPVAQAGGGLLPQDITTPTF